MLLAARVEAVVEQPWFALVALPIGYFAGLTLAYWFLFALGFDH